MAPSFPVEKMTELLDHDNLEMRAEFRKFISEPVMVPRYCISVLLVNNAFFTLFLIGQYSRYNISLEEERELALRRLQRICDNKVTFLTTIAYMLYVHISDFFSVHLCPGLLEQPVENLCRP